MVDNVPGDMVLVRGAQRTVAYARAGDGSLLAKEFLDSGQVADCDRVRLYHHFKVMADTGTVTNREYFKKVDGEIWEFKCYQVRIPTFQNGRVWFLTHAFIKKGDKWPPAQLQRANRIREDHLTWERNLRRSQ
jgi:hypothetical protein